MIRNKNEKQQKKNYKSDHKSWRLTLTKSKQILITHDCTRYFEHSTQRFSSTRYLFVWLFSRRDSRCMWTVSYFSNQKRTDFRQQHRRFCVPNRLKSTQQLSAYESSGSPIALSRTTKSTYTAFANHSQQWKQQQAKKSCVCSLCVKGERKTLSSIRSQSVRSFAFHSNRRVCLCMCARGRDKAHALA